MKKISLFIALFVFVMACTQEAEVIETTVAEAVDPAVDIISLENRINDLGNALLEPTELNLMAISHNDLTYGHSGGTIEDRAAFMDALLSGRNDYKEFEVSDQTIVVDGNTAIIRHIMDAIVGVGDEDLDVHLNVLTIWKKVDGTWIMYARQAVKV